MLDRLAPSAAAAVVQAQHEARQLRHPALGADHLLLALASDPGPVGEALRDAGLKRERLLADLAPGASPTVGQIPFSPSVGRVLDAAAAGTDRVTAADLALALADVAPAIATVADRLRGAAAAEPEPAQEQRDRVPAAVPPEPWFRPPG